MSYAPQCTNRPLAAKHSQHLGHALCVITEVSPAAAAVPDYDAPLLCSGPSSAGSGAGTGASPLPSALSPTSRTTGRGGAGRPTPSSSSEGGAWESGESAEAPEPCLPAVRIVHNTN